MPLPDGALDAATLDNLVASLTAASTGPASPDASLPRGRRRAQGAYFTPPALCELVVREALGARLAAGVRFRADGTPRLRVLDPAAGDGRFLAAAADLLAAAAPRASRLAIARRCLIGIERDPAFADAARARLPGATIHCAEALLATPADAHDVDCVVGNPPYLRSVRFDDRALREALRGALAATSHGEWDLYAAFVERAFDLLADGGELGLVTPSRWLTARFAGPLRARLASARAIRAVVDFGAAQLFAGATTYTALVFLRRGGCARARVARLDPAGGRFAVGAVDAGSLGGAPWRLGVGRRASLVDRLAAAGPTLGAVAHIVKGTGTNADRVFLDGAAAAEPALVRPCLRGRDVRGYALAPRPILYPYDAAGALVPPAVLARRFPRAAAYLAGQRAALERREGGRFAGDTFYRYGRPQNLAFLTAAAPKILVPDVAREGRAALDPGGALALDSAYAVRPRAGAAASLGLLLAILNSGIVGLWLRETGVPLRGGYVRLKTAYLDGLPLPPDGPAARRAATLALDARAAGAHAEIDDLVREAYGVPRAAWSG